MALFRPKPASPYAGTFGYNKRMQNTCNQGINNFTLSDRYLVNMAYLRMKNITVGYTIPADITTKAYVQKARVYSGPLHSR